MDEKDHNLPFDEAFRQKAATPHHVPDGYFDSLTPRILEAVRAENQKRSPIALRGINIGLRWAGALGAVALVLAVFFGLKDVFVSPSQQTISLAEATQGLTIEQVAYFTDAAPDDLMQHGLLHPDSLPESMGYDSDAAFELLLESAITDEDLSNEITI